MSNLTRSFVRGFGSALGFMAAKATVNTLTRPRTYETVVTPTKTTDEEIPQEVKLNFLQKTSVFLVWVSVIFMLGFLVNTYNIQGGLKTTLVWTNIAWIFFGWMIPTFIMANYNEKKYLPLIKQKQKELKEPFILEIESLMEKISKSPFPGWAAAMNENDRYDGDWEDYKYTYSVQHLQTIKSTFERRVKFMEKYMNELGEDKFKEITSLDEPVIGMSEKEFLLWKTNDDSLMQPFRDTLKYESLPTSIEESVSGDTENRTLVYGTKKTGSYFKFKNGKLLSFTRRD